MDPIILELLSKMINISTDIFNSIGPGYNEVIYHRAFEVALRLQNISYQTEVVTPIFYKGHNVGHGRVDLIIGNNLILELKAITNFNSDTANIQIKNYMKHYSIPNGLIINFSQTNKNNNGLNIKYVSCDKVYSFVNNTFIEITKTMEIN
jgi:GxxExxY protein